jgi:hypothetical protein
LRPEAAYPAKRRGEQFPSSFRFPGPFHRAELLRPWKSRLPRRFGGRSGLARTETICDSSLLRSLRLHRKGMDALVERRRQIWSSDDIGPRSA